MPSPIELRKDVAAVWTERQRLHPVHRRHGKLAIEMREQSSAARRFPSQPVAQPAGVDRHQNEIAFAGEVLRRRFGNLGCGGKMNEAVATIGRASAEGADAFRLAPQNSRANLVDRGGHECRRFEVPTAPAANSHRNLKSKSRTRTIDSRVPLCLRSSCQEGAAMYRELRKRGTAHSLADRTAAPHGFKTCRIQSSGTPGHDSAVAVPAIKPLPRRELS